MKYFSLILILFITLFAASFAFGQAIDPAKIKVKGIGLDSTYAQVIKALGKPVKDGKATEEGCIGAFEKEVEYAGLSIYFMDGDSKDGKTFEVKGFEVTSAKWSVSGVKVGDAESVVREKFGSSFTSSDDPDGQGDKAWFYEFNEEGSPGFLTFVFKDGKVIHINASYQVC